MAHHEGSPSRGSPCAAAGALACPGKARAATSGVISTTISTRAYCMNATSRPSPPSSSAMATMPVAPPATRPSEAVVLSQSVVRASSFPAATLSARVPALTSSTGSQEPATASSESGSR